MLFTVVVAGARISYLRVNLRVELHAGGFKCSRARDGMRFMEVALSEVSRVQKFLKISGFLCEF